MIADKELNNGSYGNFVHLHVHGHHSLLDGASSPKELAMRAKELGMTALALTDHNHLLGVIDFEKACKEEGIKPIFGCEIYYTDDINMLNLSADERVLVAKEKAIEAGVIIPPKATKKAIKELVKDYIYNTKQYHMICLAKNQTGYRSLVKLQSEASRLCTFNGRYLVDNDLLRKYHEGLIVTTACLGSRTARMIAKDQYEEAEALILEWHDIFGEDFYLEMQPLLDRLQVKTNMFYIEMHKKHHIPLVATNDVHYALEDDVDDHDTLLCVGTAKLKSDTARMRYAPEFWLRSYAEMREAFEMQSEIYVTSEKELYLYYCIEAIEMTNHIADLVEDNIQIGSSESLFPQIQVPKLHTPESYLSLLCFKSLLRYKLKHQEIDLDTYKERLTYELNVINHKGFAPYMLVNLENIKWCKTNKIPTGPGRGSAAGSLVLFLLEITKLIDPIKYQLLFSRFLTEDRTAMPDIDVDFSYEHRHEVIQHLQEQYGFYNVAHIGTITELGVKSGIKDFGRALEMPFDELNDLTSAIDEIMDYIPSYKFKHIDKLVEGSDRDKKAHTKFVLLEEKYKELFRLTRKYEGTPRNTGVHASGIVITPMPINDVFPTKTSEGVQVCLFTGVQLDALNALKLDVLGLKTLDIINNTIIDIHPNKNIYTFYDQEIVPFVNARYFKDICKLKTEAIFQIESGLFKSVIKDMQPKTIDDITALTSLCRPGPLAAKMHIAYNKRKNGEEAWDEPLPNTMEFVKDTYGCIIYQEQPMQIAQKVAGFDGNQADSFLRKAMAKKRVELLKLCQRWFVYGKRNETPPADYDPDSLIGPMYDPTGKYGAPILGGVANGYDEKLLTDFFNSLESFASYLFNKSHAATYSSITCISAYLMHYHPVKFFAQVLSIEEKKEKIDFYIDVCNARKINVLPPDINQSDIGFKAYKDHILYGLGTIAHIGKSAPVIIENRPYDSLEAIYEKVPKAFLNKTVFTNLIKAGCFDFVHTNRMQLINYIYDLRGDKKVDRLDESSWNTSILREYEKDTLKTILSVPYLFKTIETNSKCTVPGKFLKIEERNDKKGNCMGFFKLLIDEQEVDGLSFASSYSHFRLALREDYPYEIVGKKDDNGKFLITTVKALS